MAGRVNGLLRFEHFISRPYFLNRFTHKAAVFGRIRIARWLRLLLKLLRLVLFHWLSRIGGRLKSGLVLRSGWSLFSWVGLSGFARRPSRRVLARNRFGARLAEIFICRPITLRVRTVCILRIITSQQFLIEYSALSTKETALSFVRIADVIDTAIGLDICVHARIIRLPIASERGLRNLWCWFSGCFVLWVGDRWLLLVR